MQQKKVKKNAVLIYIEQKKIQMTPFYVVGNFKNGCQTAKCGLVNEEEDTAQR